MDQVQDLLHSDNSALSTLSLFIPIVAVTPSSLFTVPWPTLSSCYYGGLQRPPLTQFSHNTTTSQHNTTASQQQHNSSITTPQSCCVVVVKLLCCGCEVVVFLAKLCERWPLCATIECYKSWITLFDLRHLVSEVISLIHFISLIPSFLLLTYIVLHMSDHLFRLVAIPTIHLSWLPALNPHVSKILPSCFPQDCLRGIELRPDTTTMSV